MTIQEHRLMGVINLINHLRYIYEGTDDRTSTNLNPEFDELIQKARLMVRKQTYLNLPILKQQIMKKWIWINLEVAMILKKQQHSS